MTDAETTEKCQISSRCVSRENDAIATCALFRLIELGSTSTLHLQVAAAFFLPLEQRRQNTEFVCFLSVTTAALNGHSRGVTKSESQRGAVMATGGAARRGAITDDRLTFRDQCGELALREDACVSSLACFTLKGQNYKTGFPLKSISTGRSSPFPISLLCFSNQFTFMFLFPSHRLLKLCILLRNC